MAPLPVRKNDHPRSLFAEHAHDLQSVLPGVFHPPVGNVECVTITNLEDSRCLACFFSAVFGRSASSHLPLGEIENPGVSALLGHLQERASTSLLDVVAVGRNRHDIQGWPSHSNSPDSRLTFSLTISRSGAISRM